MLAARQLGMMHMFMKHQKRCVDKVELGKSQTRCRSSAESLLSSESAIARPIECVAMPIYPLFFDMSTM